MTPYYQDDAVTIYHGDSREWMPDADVIVTDPPYGTGAYATDTAALTPAALGQWVAAHRSVAVMGWPERLIALVLDAGVRPDEWAVWWPSNAEVKGRFAPVPLARETEHIAFFGEVREARGAPIRRTQEYVNDRNRAKHHVSPKGKRWGDVWRDASPNLGFHSAGRLHPNEKPQTLMARVLDVVADGTVLDPFMGSGTTLIATRMVGRRAIGIEIEERYCEIAANRCRQEVLGLGA